MDLDLRFTRQSVLRVCTLHTSINSNFMIIIYSWIFMFTIIKISCVDNELVLRQFCQKGVHIHIKRPVGFVKLNYSDFTNKSSDLRGQCYR